MASKAYVRSADYRERFFKAARKDARYHCAYCGRRLKERQVEVDHLIPVAKARARWMVRLMLKILGIKNINSTKNLVAACQRCNRKKSDRMGLWVIRGAIGRYRAFWVIRNTVLTIFSVVALYYLHIWFIEYNIADTIKLILQSWVG